MRAPFQVLALPYRYQDGQLQFAVFKRSNRQMWQFISGGGEDDETPEQAVCREIFEEGGVKTDSVLRLTSLCYIRTDIYGKVHQLNWPDDLYVIPEYSFAFECNDAICISDEHSEFAWLTYDQAYEVLTWDSNKTALYELNCRLTRK